MIEQVNEIADTLAWQQVEVGITQKILVSPIWFYIALIETCVLIALSLYVFCGFREYTIKKQRIKNAIKEDVDFQNIIYSSFHATEIYNELKTKCHPDLFIGNDEKIEIANRLFQEITINKTNHKRLCELKEQAQRELNVNF